MEKDRQKAPPQKQSALLKLVVKAAVDSGAFFMAPEKVLAAVKKTSTQMGIVDSTNLEKNYRDKTNACKDAFVECIQESLAANADAEPNFSTDLQADDPLFYQYYLMKRGRMELAERDEEGNVIVPEGTVARKRFGGPSSFFKTFSHFLFQECIPCTS